MNKIDTWRLVRHLVKQHDTSAEYVAARRADEMASRGDPWGEAMWKQILVAVREMQRTALGNGTPRH